MYRMSWRTRFYEKWPQMSTMNSTKVYDGMPRTKGENMYTHYDPFRQMYVNPDFFNNPKISPQPRRKSETSASEGTAPPVKKPLCDRTGCRIAYTVFLVIVLLVVIGAVAYIALMFSALFQIFSLLGMMGMSPNMTGPSNGTMAPQSSPFRSFLILDNMTYTNELANPASPEYKTLEGQLCSELQDELKSSNSFVNGTQCSVTKFQNGSVISIFQLIYPHIPEKDLKQKKANTLKAVQAAVNRRKLKTITLKDTTVCEVDESTSDIENDHCEQGMTSSTSMAPGTASSNVPQYASSDMVSSRSQISPSMTSSMPQMSMSSTIFSSMPQMSVVPSLASSTMQMSMMSGMTQVSSGMPSSVSHMSASPGTTSLMLHTPMSADMTNSMSQMSVTHVMISSVPPMSSSSAMPYSLTAVSMLHDTASTMLPAAIPPSTILPAPMPPSAMLPAAILPSTALPAAVPPSTMLPAAVPPPTMLPAAVPPPTMLPAAVPPSAMLPAAVPPSAMLPAPMPPTTMLPAAIPP